MHVYCHYFEHTTITHICNHLKQLIKFNYLQYKNLKNTITPFVIQQLQTFSPHYYIWFVYLPFQ